MGISLIASPPADAGQDMLAGLSLGISVCRTCVFGHKPGLWAAPGAQHRPAIAMCPMEHVIRMGMLMVNLLRIFPPQALVQDV